MLKKGFTVCSREAHPDFMKFITFSTSRQAQKGFCQAMEPFFEIIDRGSGHFTEYVLKGCSKAGGMLALLDALGVPQSETLALGDSTNDLPMFRIAAHTACLGGGMEELKAVSEFVTAPVLEDGIQKALEHFGLLEEHGRSASAELTMDN